MKFEMRENSLFAVLLRSQWWISAALAAAIVALAFLLLPKTWAVYGASMAVPIAVIAVIAGFRGLRVPSARRVEATLKAVRAMSWDRFEGLVAAAFGHDGYQVAPLSHQDAEFELRKGDRVSLVACKRWKAARTGIEPLRALRAAGDAREAGQCIYIAAGEVTDQARSFAAGKQIRILTGTELTQFLKPALDEAKS